MTRNKWAVVMIAVLTLGLSACNLIVSRESPDPSQTPGSVQPVPTREVSPPVTSPTETSSSVTGPEDICLVAETGETRYVNEAGGYCLLIPEGFEVTQDMGLDIFVVGPTLATYGQEGLVLAFDFSVVGAPGGAGDYDAHSWGEQVAEENSEPDFELTIEPYSLSGAGLEGVRVGPMPGMAGGEAAVVRTNDTLYSLTVYPDRAGSPEFAEQVEALWSQLSASIRFFEPISTGVEYKTAEEVCPAKQPGTNLVIRDSEGWCVLIPDS